MTSKEGLFAKATVLKTINSKEAAKVLKQIFRKDTPFGFQ
jgi:hypothetical protein